MLTILQHFRFRRARDLFWVIDSSPGRLLKVFCTFNLRPASTGHRRV